MKRRAIQFRNWFDKRFPRKEVWDNLAVKYYAPKNLNFWYFFGVLSFVVLVSQLVSGVYLTMHYVPTAEQAFDSVEYLMREVDYGWLLRYMHTTGASAFFIVIYLHMYRAMLYGSYRSPREVLWLFGMVIYTLLIGEAFTGYILPWGQMSYWASKVITSLIAGIPVIGQGLAVWVMGDYSVSGITLHRFFAFHVTLIPMLIVLWVILHIMALRKCGSNNPDGIEIKETLDFKGIPKDGVPFHPYYTVKDLVGVAVYLILFCAVMFFAPTFGGHFLEPVNFQQANPMVTPQHIAPVWYLAPFYAVLRAVPNKLFGILAMGSGIIVLYILPWLDRSPVKSIRYKGIYSKIALAVFTISFLGLGYYGTQPVTPIGTILTRIFTLGYFGYFFLMPIYTRMEVCKPAPKRVTYHG